MALYLLPKQENKKPHLKSPVPKYACNSVLVQFQQQDCTKDSSVQLKLHENRGMETIPVQKVWVQKTMQLNILSAVHKKTIPKSSYISTKTT